MRRRARLLRLVSLSGLVLLTTCQPDLTGPLESERTAAESPPAAAKSAPPSETLMYVTTDQDGGSVAVIETATNTLLATIPVGVDGTFLRVNPTDVESGHRAD
jgi:YVTN family beta-propeller protein